MSQLVIDYVHVISRWQEILVELKSGNEVILTENGVPKARVLPLARRQPGLHLGSFKMSSDFDDPLPDEFWLGEDIK